MVRDKYKCFHCLYFDTFQHISKTCAPFQIDWDVGPRSQPNDMTKSPSLGYIKVSQGTNTITLG